MNYILLIKELTLSRVAVIIKGVSLKSLGSCSPKEYVDAISRATLSGEFEIHQAQLVVLEEKPLRSKAMRLG